MSTWISCANAPTRHDWYLVERRFSTGEQLEPPESIRWTGKWEVAQGFDLMPWDVYREMGEAA